MQPGYGTVPWCMLSCGPIDMNLSSFGFGPFPRPLAACILAIMVITKARESTFHFPSLVVQIAAERGKLKL